MVVIEKDTGKGFQFLLQSDTGETLLSSIYFATEADARLHLDFLKQHKRFERKTNHSGKFFFNVWDGEGKLLGSSEPYASEAGMENGIQNLQQRIALLSDAGVL